LNYFTIEACSEISKKHRKVCITIHKTANILAYFISVNILTVKINSPAIIKLIIIQVFLLPYSTNEYFYSRGAQYKRGLPMMNLKQNGRLMELKRTIVDASGRV